MSAELLHVGALGAAGLGTCCVALDAPRPRLRELSLSIVMFLAMLDVVTAAHLAQWFRAADAVVMPSFSESFGLVALEAQACGMPVVAANVGGLPQAISDGRSGLLVDGHSAHEWADALERLHDDDGLRERLGRGAATHALAFGWQRTALLTAQSYRTAVDRFPAATTR